MHAKVYDAIVIGLGGMGSAAAAHLASRGQRVLGLEQFTPLHDRGSSHGETRIIRKAYFEQPAYVPLLQRAYELWLELEGHNAGALYLKTGGLMVGKPDSPLVQGALYSARAHALAHEILDAAQLRRRYPATRPDKAEIALFEEPAGILFPEACVRSYLDRAAYHGAELRFQTEVAGWQPLESGAEVTTGAGERFSAERLIVTAGAWLGALMADLALPLRVERNVVHWFDPAAEAQLFAPAALPVYILDRAGHPMLYGFPDVGSGIKAAFHHSQVYVAAQDVDRRVRAGEVQSVREALTRWLPDGNGAHRASSVCLYTLTPDEHFLVGFHPKHPSVIIAGGFSGHGFKFCSVIGEVVADLACAGRTPHPIELFDLERFTRQKGGDFAVASD